MERDRNNDYLFFADSIRFNALEGLQGKALQRETVKRFQYFLKSSPLYKDQYPVGRKYVPKWVMRLGQPWPKTALVDGMYLYTVMPDGELRISRDPDQAASMSHPDLAIGNEVIAAGQLFVVGGKISHLNNKSGHYQPDPSSCLFAKAVFRFWGVPLEDGCEEVNYS